MTWARFGYRAFALRYWSLGRGWSQVVGSPRSGRASSTAKWVMKVPAVAPCQCSSPGGLTTVSPAPMRRYATPEEIAPSVVYLASDASAFMTGTVLVIDGGYTLF